MDMTLMTFVYGIFAVIATLYSIHLALTYYYPQRNQRRPALLHLIFFVGFSVFWWLRLFDAPDIVVGGVGVFVVVLMLVLLVSGMQQAKKRRHEDLNALRENRV